MISYEKCYLHFGLDDTAFIVVILTRKAALRGQTLRSFDCFTIDNAHLKDLLKKKKSPPLDLVRLLSPSQKGSKFKISIFIYFRSYWLYIKFLETEIVPFEIYIENGFIKIFIYPHG